MANVADAVSQVIRWVINLAPFGIMGLVFANVSDERPVDLHQVRPPAAPARRHHAAHGARRSIRSSSSIYLHRNPYPLVLPLLQANPA